MGYNQMYIVRGKVTGFEEGMLLQIKKKLIKIQRKMAEEIKFTERIGMEGNRIKQKTDHL